MPVPWEALLPFGILSALFAVTGTGLNTAKMLANDGKPPRYNMDEWDTMMMERDRRLTGRPRGQSTEVKAPTDFETNSVWHTEKVSTQ